MTTTTAPATGRNVAWDTLGTAAAGADTAEQVLERTGLAGWNVRKTPMYATIDGEQVQPEGRGRWGIIRDLTETTMATGDGSAPTRLLGTVGNHYHPVQNEELAAFMNTLVDEAGAHYHAAGALNGGRKVFVSMRLPEGIQVGGVDPVDLYLTAFNSHDGQGSFSFVVTPVRVWCANMQAVATKQALSKFKSRHTRGGVGAKVQEARAALDLTFAYQGQFQAEADRLIDQAYTDQQFTRLTASLFPTPDAASDAIRERQTAHRTALMSLFRESDTATNIRSTRWAAFQAVTEYTDHVIAKQGYAGDALRTKRAVESISPTSSTSKLKDRAYMLLTK